MTTANENVGSVKYNCRLYCRFAHVHFFHRHTRQGKKLATFDGNTPFKKSTLLSRNITVVGHRTSVRLEPEMWTALRDIARREQCKVHDICSLIQLRKNASTSLTAAIRVFLMLYYRASSTDDGHHRAGHGSFDNMIVRARMNTAMLKPCIGDAAQRDVQQAG